MPRLRKLIKPEMDMVTIIRDVRDGSMDYKLSRERADALIAEGKLARYDVTSRGNDICHVKNGTPRYKEN